MDLYLINGHEGISLPEMIDWDIKLCDSEISKEVGISSLIGVGYELPSLEIEEEVNPLWAQSYSANSNSSFELDFLGEGSSLLVNPSSVMPYVSSRRGVPKVEDGEVENVEKKSESGEYLTATIKKELTSSSKYFPKEEIIDDVHVEEEIELGEEDVNTDVRVNDEEVVCEQSVTFDNSEQNQGIMTLPLEFVSVPVDSSFSEVIQPKKGISNKRQVVPFNDDMQVKCYPKPAYSYSCLIAMALKNSLTGCLPVSEIYSFMCHHFPYFKTAPNGWKNSVRHNLSLNKCFEKIEKPPGNGTSGSQRKGCLWAMNPAKINKMDEEVAKWSRKDPSAIKKAMVFPENLELLERGEMKDFTAFSEEEVEEDAEEMKEEEEEEDVDDFGGDVEDERVSPIDDDSEDEISRVPPSLQPFEPKFAQFTRHKMFTKTRDSLEKSVELNSSVDFDVGDNVYELEVSSNRTTLFGLDESTPVYSLETGDDNILIEIPPMVKKPRVQGNYIYQPVLSMKRHNINGFRSIKIQSP